MQQPANIPDDFGNPWMSNLKEIALPDPVSRFPQTVGWLLLAGLLLAGMLWLFLRLRRHHLANAYRREALNELSAIERLAGAKATRPGALQAIPRLLKRTALAAYPRTEVARLSGTPWLEFLDERVGGTDFAGGVGRRLPDLAYNAEAATRMPDVEARALVTLARRWIHGHRPGRT